MVRGYDFGPVEAVSGGDDVAVVDQRPSALETRPISAEDVDTHHPGVLVGLSLAPVHNPSIPVRNPTC